MTTLLTPSNEADLQSILAATPRPYPQGAATHTWASDQPPDHTPISLKNLSTIHDIDLQSGLVLADAGVTIGALAEALAPSLTLAHFGPLPAGATLGGLLARRGPASPSWYRPDVQGACTGLHAVTFSGERFEYIPAPRKASGPDLRGFWVGSAGQHGVITAAHIAVARAPETQTSLTASAPASQALLEALFATVRAGAQPWSASLWITEAGGSLTVTFAGPEALVGLHVRQFQAALDAQHVPSASGGEQHPALLHAADAQTAAEDTLYAPLRLPSVALCSGSGHLNTLRDALSLGTRPGFALLISQPSPTDAAAALLNLSDSDAPPISAEAADAAIAQWRALPWRWTPPQKNPPPDGQSWRARWLAQHL